MPEADSTSDRGRRGRRLRRVLRIALFLLAGAAVGAVVLLAKLHRDEARLDACVERIRRRGEPLAWRDFATTRPAVAENAAEHHRQAAGTYRRAFGLGDAAAAHAATRARRGDLVDLLRDGVLAHRRGRPGDARRVREALALSKEVLGLCRRARRCRSADWGIRFRQPVFRWRPPRLRELSDVGDLLCLDALRANEDGETAGAVERLRDAMALARSVESVLCLTAFETADRIRREVCLAIEEMAPRLSAAREDGEAHRAARGLIADLLRRDGFDRAILGERSMAYEMAERARAGRLSLRRLPRWPQGRTGLLGGGGHLGAILPAFYAADEAELLAKMAGDVEAARAATYPQACDARRTLPRRRFANASCTLVALLLPRLNRSFKVRFRNLATRRMAAAALAMRLYELDHGHRPKELAELVPEYLAAVPDDPFARDAAAVRYLPARDCPRLYSVFKNAREDRGSFFVGSRGHLDLVDSPDLVFFLDGNCPPPPGRRGLRPASARSGSTP